MTYVVMSLGLLVASLACAFGGEWIASGVFFIASILSDIARILCALANKP